MLNNAYLLGGLPTSKSSKKNTHKVHLRFVSREDDQRNKIFKTFNYQKRFEKNYQLSSGKNCFQLHLNIGKNFIENVNKEIE